MDEEEEGEQKGQRPLGCFSESLRDVSWGLLGSLLGPLGSPGGLLGRLGCLRGASWGLLGPRGGLLGASWGTPWALLGALEALLGQSWRTSIKERRVLN